MSISIYKLKPKRGTIKGCAYLMFTNGVLNTVNWEFNTPLSQVQKDYLRPLFPFEESEIEQLKEAFTVDLLQPRSAHDKLKHFCMYFKAKRGTNYTPKKQEKANIKNVVVNDGLLNAYFSSDAFPLNYSKSVNDFIKHYNYIRDININGKPEKSAFPNEYNLTFERTLNSQDLSKYWKHLRQLGWLKNDKGVWVAPGELDLN